MKYKSLFVLILHLFFSGCKGPSALTSEQEKQIAIYGMVAQSKVGSGKAISLQVELYGPVGSEFVYQGPHAKGLQIHQQGKASLAQVGSRQRKRYQYELSGKDGSYIIFPGQMTIDKTSLKAAPVFVDIGIIGPSSSLAKQEQMPQQLGGFSWMILAGVLVLAIIGGFLWKRRGNKELSEAQKALMNWEKAKNGNVDDYALAIELSLIFRHYLDAILGSNTLHLSPLEALNWIENSKRLSTVQKKMAQRLLSATDRLKFARDGGGYAFFDSLGSDLAGFISSMQPKEEQR